MSDVREMTAADAGTWLEGAQGWTNSYRAVERAIAWGWTVPEEYAEGWQAFVENYGDSDLWCDANGDDGSFVDAATDYLQSIAPEGYVFRWDDGLSLLPAWSDCAADGNGCDVEERKGGPFVTPCPDHKPERKIRVVLETLSVDYDVYSVTLWDESDEVLSGTVDVTLSPPVGFGLTGEFWFPEVIQNKRVREAAEHLIREYRESSIGDAGTGHGSYEYRSGH